MISSLLKEKVSQSVKKALNIDLLPDEIHIEHPKNMMWGDYSTNVAMILSKRVQQSASDVAKKIVYELQSYDILLEVEGESVKIFEKIEFKLPGFINFTISDDLLLRKSLNNVYDIEIPKSKNNIGQERTKKVLFEYTDPNPFKVIHIGHLMSNSIGEALSRLYQFGIYEVKKSNYQGDVGLHVAKAIWGISKNLEEQGKTMTDIDSMKSNELTDFLGSSYALGAHAYEKDKEASKEMESLNYYVYKASQERLVSEENWTPLVDYQKFIDSLPGDQKDVLETKFPYETVKNIYIKGRDWSLRSFETFYDIMGTKFDYYFFESVVGEYGLDIVKSNIGNVFTKDQGAVIFEGEKYGLHNRVFVNSKGLPTYESKDLGLAKYKYEKYPYDLSFIITGNEVDEYFKVVLKAMEQISPELVKKTTHIGHGMMRFKSGKMSSRTGDVITANTLITETRDLILTQMEESESPLSGDERFEVANMLAVGAIKYSILKQGPGRDIIYDEEGSLSITGNTGPYLQYTHARAGSVLTKSLEMNWTFDLDNIFYLIKNNNYSLHEKETEVLRHLIKFEDYVKLAREELSPNLICSYLFELAQHYNGFYNDVTILGAEDKFILGLRLQITKQVKEIMRVGLWLLGIKAPEKV